MPESARRRWVAADDDWRVEADDEWLARHRSDTFGRLKRRFGRFGLISDAVSNAELGPFGGAPRKPQLKIGGKAYAVVRYTQHRIAYTVIQVDPDECRRCGALMQEVHRIVQIREGGVREVVGAVRMCRQCAADAWLFVSHMPTTNRARRVSRRVVL